MGVILATPAATKHNMFSAFHSDAVTAAVSRGSLPYGNSTPAWDELTIGGAGTFLKSDGADMSWQTLAVADISDIAATYLKLDASNDPVTGALDINIENTGAGGDSGFQSFIYQTDGTAMTGTLRGAYLTASNGNTAATGTIRGAEIKARAGRPGETGNDVNVLEGFSVSSDAKTYDVTVHRGGEIILDGGAGTSTLAVGLRIANNFQANRATTSYGLQIYRDSFDYTADIQLSSGGTIGGSSGDFRIDANGVITPGQEINAATTDEPVLILQTTDDNAANNIQEWQDSGGNIQASISANGGAVFNEEGNDADFRVEGATENNTLWVDASVDGVGIGASPNAFIKFWVGGRCRFGDALYLDENLILRTNDTSILMSDTEGNARVFFYFDAADDLWIGPAGSPAGTTTNILFNPGSSTKMTLSEDGSLLLAGFGAAVVGFTIKGAAAQSANLLELQNSNAAIYLSTGDGLAGSVFSGNHQLLDIDFVWAGDTEANLFRIDAGLDAVRIGDWDTNYVSTDKAGDVTFVGGAGLAFGSMYTNADIAMAVGTATWVEVDAAQAWTTGKVHNCSFADPKITVTAAGTYFITYDLTILSSLNNKHIETGIMIDSDATDGPAHGAAGVQNEGRTHEEFVANTVESTVSSRATIQLAAGKTVSLAVMNVDVGDPTVTVSHGNLVVIQIAGVSA